MFCSKKHMTTFIATFVLSIFFIFGRVCHAQEDYKIMQSKEAVDSKKVWTIKFNNAVDYTKMSDYIQVYEYGTNHKVQFTLSYNSENKLINVTPLSSYENNKTYTLEIDSGLKSSIGKELKTPVKFNFTIKDSTITQAQNSNNINIDDKEKLLQEKTNQIVAQVIKPNMKDYEKELALHDYLVTHSTYDKRLFTGNMPDESYTDYGVLIKGTGVCEGYAKAMKRLLDAVGIETIVAIGEAKDGEEWIGHAWNIIKIEEQYYQLDPTWDDPITSDGKDVLRHSYFNITDKQISKDHRWDGNYPTCNSTTYNYYNLSVPEKDDDGQDITTVRSYYQFYGLIKSSMENSVSSISMKILNYNETTYDVSAALNKIMKSNPQIDYRGCSIKSYYDDVNNVEYVKIIFEK
ncbi:transglutaminase domain-containing protein [Clostridium sp. OS1-26]|uniref:transglutaminase domain-containing protein n=1 Tax=Clostridium sp. OS1-26 TaxID=3070681 RepID=UPI0027E114E4|nr:transglutaminase domain-containing protein [Clostridium sp. OS1-26]WML37154.1 Ig-like domain-containing protein [Clostridium sp. OS1-26]